MCGFVGVKLENAEEAVNTMLDQIEHRGPDDRRLATLASWSVGHVRLSVIDPEGAPQPMTSRSGRSTIVYNGEIYNFNELKAMLGADWKTKSDTEVLLALYESDRDPADWIRLLDGMFAFAIIGPKGLLLARDPLGVKPLYIGKVEDKLVFASEMKALLTQTHQFIEFPPGHFLASRGGVKQYYALPEDTKSDASFEKAAREVRRLLCDSVQSRMLSDVPLGAFLSGGLDSSIIAAIAVRQNRKLKTFSVGMEGSPDLAAAREVAQYLKTDHYERTFTPREAVDVLPKVIRQLESFDSALVRSAIPNYFLAELASQHVKVALSGEGADELFAGYEYLWKFKGEALRKELATITRSLFNTNLQRCDRMSMAHGLEVRVPFLDNSELVEYALALPSQFKLNRAQGVVKWVLREAFRDWLPAHIIDRKKEKFADGAGIGKILGVWASNQSITFGGAHVPPVKLRDREEALYYYVFHRCFKSAACTRLVGRSKSV